MPNPQDTIQAIDAVTGDLIWEYRRDRPDDLGDYMIGSLIDTNRSIAIHGELIFHTSIGRPPRRPARRDGRGGVGTPRSSTTR